MLESPGLLLPFSADDLQWVVRVLGQMLCSRTNARSSRKPLLITKIPLAELPQSPFQHQKCASALT